MEKSVKILLVEDELIIADYMQECLTRFGYKVVDTCINYNEAVKALAAKTPDIVLLDKSLGWADGCDLCQCIKSHRKLSPIPVIMFSAHTRKEDIMDNCKADDFIAKPFEVNELLRKLNSTIVAHDNRN